MLHFLCPTCRAILSVEDQYAGHTGRCFSCATAVVIPAQSTHWPDGRPLDGSRNIIAEFAPPKLPDNATQTDLIRTVNILNETVLRMIRFVDAMMSMVRGDLELRTDDLKAMLRASLPGAADPVVRLETDFPVASDSPDHIHPRGTSHDNTRWPRFVSACEKHFGRKLRYLDLGCAGGGMVLDFLLRGHLAVGLEGSDYSRRVLRGEWRTIPHNLFTCDVSRPFRVYELSTGQPFKADVIAMWEVLEHIAPARLPELFSNIRQHLTDDGLFVASVAMFSDQADGVEYHATIEPRSWWEEALRENGLTMIDEPVFEPFDFCRGIGRDVSDPSYYPQPFDNSGLTSLRPGFHVVARKSPLGRKAGTVPASQSIS